MFVGGEAREQGVKESCEKEKKQLNGTEAGARKEELLLDPKSVREKEIPSE